MVVPGLFLPAQSEVARDPGQTVAGGPAHDAGERVHGSPTPELPQSGVGLVEEQRRAPAECFEAREEHRVAAMRQALVEEDVADGENRQAVDVVLDLAERVVAVAHRPHAAVPGQAGDDLLDQGRVAVDAVDRLQRGDRRLQSRGLMRYPK